MFCGTPVLKTSVGMRPGAACLGLGYVHFRLTGYCRAAILPTTEFKNTHFPHILSIWYLQIYYFLRFIFLTYFPICSFLLLLRFYLFIHETHRERQTHRQKEKQAPCREPYVGLNPGTPGSRPGPLGRRQALNR